MRNTWLRRVAFWSALAVVGLAGRPALANGLFGRRAGFVTTEFIAVAPTAYYMPTSYLVPTVYAAPVVETSYVVTAASHVVPTVYAATSYVVPTMYLAPTSYVVPTSYVLSDPFVPTSLVEYLPTSYECCLSVPVVSSGDPCGVPVSAPAAAATPSTPAGKGTDEGTSSAVKQPPSTLDSIPANEPAGPAQGESSAVKPPPTNVQKPAAGSPGIALPPESNVVSPPAAPVPDRDLGTTGATPVTPPAPINSTPAPKGATAPATPTVPSPPVAPGGDLQLPIEPAPGAVLRESRRPVFSAVSRSATQPFRHPMKNGNLTALQGKVVADGNREPEDGVRVTLSNRRQTFADRVVTTDALGRYAVWLPDGDWTVRIESRSGRTYTVSQLTVVEGQITDDQGRDVPSLTISR